MLLIILLNLAPFNVLLESVGIAIIIPAGLILLGFSVFHLIFFTLDISNLNIGLPSTMMPLAIALIKAIIGRFLIQTEIISGSLVIFAIILFILAHVFYKRSKNKVNLTAPPVLPKNFDTLPVKK